MSNYSNQRCSVGCMGKYSVGEDTFLTIKDVFNVENHGRQGYKR